MWIRTFSAQLAQDLRYALRMMAGNPLFTAMAALSLALGIGANTAIFSFVDAILMRALPVQDPESLVMLHWRAKEYPGVAKSFSGSNWLDPKFGMVSGNFPFPAWENLKTNNKVFSSIFAFNGAGRINVMIRGQADLTQGTYVSGDFFRGVGVPPAAGRLIDAGDDRVGAPGVAVISFNYAKRRFGEASRAVGEPVLLNNTPFTIIGVAAPEFFGVNPAGVQDVYLPMFSSGLLEASSGGTPNRTRYLDQHFYWVQMMGRLRQGVTMAQAQAALAPVFHNFVNATAKNDKERADLPVLLLQPGAGGLNMLRRQFSKPLYVLMTLVGLILAIACANIANLLLARATARRREMAVRLSLGAGRGRVMRQLLTESVLLAALGGLLGVLFANWGIRFLTLLIANGRENFTLHASLNWNVLGVTLALSAATGLLFGLAPAVQATRVDLTSALKQSRAGEPRLRWRRSFLRVGLSHVLVVSQISISLLLLAAAAIFVRSLSNLNSVALGFNQERVLLFSLNAKQAGYKDDALGSFYANLRTSLNSVPGIRSVTMSDIALVSASRSATGVRLASAEPAKFRGTDIMRIGPSFFTTMQIPILLGREFDERDRSVGTQVAVVNETFVKTYFPNKHPIGKRYGLGGSNAVDREIVGVVKDARYNSLKDEIRPTSYIPYTQGLQTLGQITFEVRAAGDPLALVNTVRRMVQQADARIPVSNVVTQERQISQTIGQERTFATLCTVFALLAVVIACVGLYGTMAYSVARRTSEIGVRMALGAERPRLLWMVLREVVAMAAVGLAIGLPVVFATSKLVKAFLFGMQPNDPLAISAAAVILLAAAVAAGYGPAWRASRIDPWKALRHE
jgi:predicted permease